MTQDSKFEAESKGVESMQGRHGVVSRRNLMRAGLAATPVILATSGRSALAGTATSTPGLGLSPMAWLSANPSGALDPMGLSHAVGHNALGRSPGYWIPNKLGKTFQGPWPSDVAPFQTLIYKQNGVLVTKTWVAAAWNDYSDLPYDNESGQDAGWNTGTVLSWLGDSRSISRILIDGNGSLKWHTCAAYLNAKMSEQAGLSGSAAYALTSLEVQQIYTTRQLVSGSGTLSDSVLKAFFDQTWS